MNTFGNREKTFEKKFAHDEETKFKINARRNKLLGLWAAEYLGLEGDDADAYAKQVVKADFEEPGDEDVFRKVWNDLQAKELYEGPRLWPLIQHLGLAFVNFSTPCHEVSSAEVERRTFPANGCPEIGRNIAD